MTFRPGLTPTILTVIGLVILCSLGTWQVKRLAWKEGLLALIDERMARPPVSLPVDIPDAEQWRYAPAQVQGRFDHDREVTVFAGRQRTGGWYVYTPLIREEGDPVLVNRGWVPDDKRLPSSRPETLIDTMVTITGIGRLSRPAGRFTPAPDPEGKRYFSADLAMLANAMGLKDVSPVMLDATASSSPILEAGQTHVAIPNNHLEYAFTWFALAAVLAGVYGAYGFGRTKTS